jgi:hypothetical protein
MLAAGRGSLGWSAEAVASHVAFWMSRCADALEAIAAGSYDPEAFSIDVDAENERRLPAWHEADLATARADLDAARERVLTAWSKMDDPGDAAVGWFEGDTFEHYDEHMEATDGS